MTKTTAHTKTTITLTTRNAGLRQMLQERRSEVQLDLQSHLRDGRTARQSDVNDAIDLADADAQSDLDLALLQMKSETLTHIDAALVRLDAGAYGSCLECNRVIAEERLRALPFAVRCQGCQERRERAQVSARRLEQRRGGLSLFSDAAPV
jgi:DnaK suppressor protein